MFSRVGLEKIMERIKKYIQYCIIEKLNPWCVQKYTESIWQSTDVLFVMDTLAE